LPTIVSRLQIIRLKPLPLSVIEDMIREQLGLEPEPAAVLASLSEGSPGKALALDRTFVLEVRKRVLGRLLALNPGNPSQLFEFARELSDLREDPEEVLGMLAGFYRDLLWDKTGVSARMNVDMEGLIQEESRRVGLEKILEKLAVISETRKRLEGNANRLLAMEFLTMALKELPGTEVR